MSRWQAFGVMASSSPMRLAARRSAICLVLASFMLLGGRVLADGACGGEGARQDNVASRNPALWPFDASSPWNTPLGSKARFSEIRSPAFSTRGGANLNVSSWSHPIFVAQAGDPLVTVSAPNFGMPVSYRIHVPISANPDPAGDGAMHVIEETHRYVVEMWRARRVGNSKIVAAAAVRNDLTDSGVYETWHGARAYGGSAIGGLIRRHELERKSIPHALAIAVEGTALNRRARGGKSWVWPASASDGGRFYSESGNLYMGSLLAIPANVDIESLGLSQQATAVGHALQDYGAYIVDKGGGNIIFYVEPAANEILAMTARELGALVAELMVVENNGPASIGGGGTPRCRSAPPLSVGTVDELRPSGNLVQN